MSLLLPTESEALHTRLIRAPESSTPNIISYYSSARTGCKKVRSAAMDDDNSIPQLIVKHQWIIAHLPLEALSVYATACSVEPFSRRIYLVRRVATPAVQAQFIVSDC